MVATTLRTNKLPYYKLRADAAKTFTGLGVRQDQSFKKSNCKRGFIEAEPVHIPRRTPEIQVRWTVDGIVNAALTALPITRVELSGPDRLRAAAPGLSDGQLLWIAGVDNWEMPNWPQIDEAADRWDRLRKVIAPMDGMDVHELRAVPDLTDAQRGFIAEVARKTDKLVSSKELAERWAKASTASTEDG